MHFLLEVELIIGRRINVHACRYIHSRRALLIHKKTLIKILVKIMNPSPKNLEHRKIISFQF